MMVCWDNRKGYRPLSSGTDCSESESSPAMKKLTPELDNGLIYGSLWVCPAVKPEVLSQ